LYVDTFIDGGVLEYGVLSG